MLGSRPISHLLIPHVFSIVAVHGLGGDPFATWTHPKSKAFWLKDFLPSKIPDARIMTFGYNAGTAFGNSTADIIDHAKSLLSSLIDKREELEVQTSWSLGQTMTRAKKVYRGHPARLSSLLTLLAVSW